jgi:5-methylcytosine-specific restriction enzyme A
MPNAAPKPCTYPRCTALAHDGTWRCGAHARESWAKGPQATKRITGRRRQALSAALFRANPLCVECQAQGRVALATQRDHIKPLAEGGTEDADNTQGLCDTCHEAKSQREAQRGRWGDSQ